MKHRKFQEQLCRNNNGMESVENATSESTVSLSGFWSFKLICICCIQFHIVSIAKHDTRAVSNFMLHVLSLLQITFTTHVLKILGFCLCKIYWLGLLAEESHELEGDNTKTSSRSVEERLIRVITQLATEEEECLTEEENERQVKNWSPKY